MAYDYIPNWIKLSITLAKYSEDKNMPYKLSEDFAREKIIENKAFIISKVVGKALQNSKAKFDISLINPPFRTLTIFPEDFVLNQSEGKVLSIACFECISVIYDKDNRQVYFPSKDTTINDLKNKIKEFNIEKGNEGKKVKVLHTIFCFTICEDNGLYIFYLDNLDSKNVKIIGNFVKSFFMFLNNPEISFIEHKTNSEKNNKRILRGKVPLPIKVLINITGKLKIYLDNYEKESLRSPFSYRFWVRGHFRHLWSDKWKNKKGQTTWILPYVKGKGILINKSYELVRGDVNG